VRAPVLETGRSVGLARMNSRVDGRGWGVAPPLVAAAISLAAMYLGWHGVDWPAQLYRVHLFRAHGWIAFDTGWYGGHSPIAYSTLFPPLAAMLGVRAAAVACAATAAWAFDRLVCRRYGRHARVGSLGFAAGTVVQVAIGQLSFLLGLALGLLAVLALVSHRPRLASLTALACALASFVAAFFLILAAVAWAATARPGRRRELLLLTVAATAPVAAVSVVYRQIGRFPYPATSLAGVLVLCAGALLILPAQERTLRTGATLYAAVAALLFVVHTPVGANVTRLATTVAVPVLACAVPRLRRPLLAMLAVFVVGWQFAPALGAIGIDGRDASTRSTYFAPLLAELKRVQPTPARVEIPFTHEHWEAIWVAPTVPLARGWERQLDIVDNALFYRPGPLNPVDYQSWLNDNGISWVALPNVALDYSARAEAALLRTGARYLKPIWHDAHWQLWRVEGSPGLISGPARLTSLSADGFTIIANRPGSVIVRIRYTPTWTIKDDGAGCLTKTEQAWTVVRAARAGPIRVAARLIPTGDASC
jgi:hypothetical protein